MQCTCILSQCLDSDAWRSDVVPVLCQGHPMDPGFETALDTCLENAAGASRDSQTESPQVKQAEEKKVD